MAADGLETGEGLFKGLAQMTGSTEPALKLLISILLGYPLAFVYRKAFWGKRPDVQHTFFAACGILVCYFNYGFDVFHSFGCVLVVHLLLRFKGGTKISVWIAYTYFMAYLLVGYYLTETEEYDIIWTMPHCVLTLRLIGLVVDVSDGRKSKEELSAGQKEVTLSQTPSLLEIFGYVYFFGGFMAGPQFPMKRYLQFTSGQLNKDECGPPKSVTAGLIRGATGVCYLVCLVIGNAYIPTYYLLSDDFKSSSLLGKHLLLGLWGKLVYGKYTICWTLAEGSCTVMGITYNGKDENGNELWNGCTNVRLFRFETATQYSHIIQSFNILTNKWAAHYIYKRLKFMGSKLVSQAITLLFLAVWHGLSYGYYACFAHEFACTKLEGDVAKILANHPSVVSFLNRPIVKPIKLAVLRIYIAIFSAYSIVPFVMLTWSKTHQVHKEMYYSGTVFYFGWLLVSPIVLAYLKRRAPKDDEQAKKAQ